MEEFLELPQGARELIIFAHGSGSSRLSPRNRYVAEFLRAGGLGTLLFDLLTPEEDRVDRVTAELRFNIDLLAERVISATRWVRAQPRLSQLRLGYFGASTGAAAAIVAAAKLPGEIAAIVSRGGRPDLAGSSLKDVSAPVLLIVGSEDRQVLDLNRRAAAMMHDAHIAIVPGATHLFEEPGALEEVAKISRNWFARG